MNTGMIDRAPLKKGKIGRLGFGSSSVKYINFKKYLLERGKLWKSMKMWIFT
jgi:hypothetical protein